MLLPYILLFLTSAIWGQTHEFDITSCRMTMTCGGDREGSSANYVRAAAVQGKKGPKGIKGDIGQKGDKGGYREYDSELESLRRKISELKTQKKCPQTKFLFPSAKQVTDYIRIKTAILEMDELTICTWFTPSSASVLTDCGLISYATSGGDNTITLIFRSNQKFALFLNNEEIPMTVDPITERTHLCFTVSRGLGWANVYINGVFKRRLAFTKRNSIYGGGAFIIGQEQDGLFDRLAPSQAFAGIVENFVTWHRVLNETDIRELHRDPCKCPTDYAISLSLDQIQLEGRVIAQPTGEC